MSTFISFQTNQIRLFKLSNKKQLLNNFISNKIYRRWLPLLLPTILGTEDFPNGFDRHLADAKHYVDDKPTYTDMTSKIITYFLPDLMSVHSETV